MTPAQRIQLVLEGKKPDRPPVSFWHHFPPDRIFGQAAVEAHLDHLRRYDLDFLKVMNDNPYPHAGIVRAPADLSELKELNGDEEGFGRQLELISALRRALGPDIFMSTTIFNAWMILRHLIKPPTEHMPPVMDASADQPSGRIKQMLSQSPELVRWAIRRIGTNLANFARRCIEAGADGVFLSVRDDWVDSPAEPHLYEQIVREADLEILHAASAGRFNILHMCGNAVHFRELSLYPVHAVSWADRSAGPAISEVKDWLGPAICAGVDNLGTLATGTPADVQREVEDALRQAGDRPMIIAPGCTYDPHRVPPQNLEALSRAAHDAKYL